jgi:hypothetical protein
MDRQSDPVESMQRSQDGAGALVMFHVPEKFRITKGHGASDKGFGNNGAFWVPIKGARGGLAAPFKAIASDGAGWEHVSVSLPKRCPTWDEMCIIKDLFWDPTDAVIQIHPPKAEYVSYHPYCLHLWRKTGTNAFFEAPPSILVGPQT